ncbi:hypothetical protein JOC48_000503 [Aquibacillus albus]|uniref:Uncharacterized protein n=1 Tax=Aquibacillus albus TaxID=1168171 RepID=A0ABS2MW03_9BACI|nr:hypothetical protein [Aquibacillus albus]
MEKNTMWFGAKRKTVLRASVQLLDCGKNTAD